MVVRGMIRWIEWTDDSQKVHQLPAQPLESTTDRQKNKTEEVSF